MIATEVIGKDREEYVDYLYEVEDSNNYSPRKLYIEIGKISQLTNIAGLLYI